MSEQARTDFEALLRRALAPVEPPADLAARLESTLTTLTELAAEELDAWELRRCATRATGSRPVAAAAIGTAAGARRSSCCACARRRSAATRRAGRRASSRSARCAPALDDARRALRDWRGRRARRGPSATRPPLIRARGTARTLEPACRCPISPTRS